MLDTKKLSEFIQIQKNVDLVNYHKLKQKYDGLVDIEFVNDEKEVKINTNSYHSRLYNPIFTTKEIPDLTICRDKLNLFTVLKYKGIVYNLPIPIEYAIDLLCKKSLSINDLINKYINQSFYSTCTHCQHLKNDKCTDTNNICNNSVINSKNNDVAEIFVDGVLQYENKILKTNGPYVYYALITDNFESYDELFNANSEINKYLNLNGIYQKIPNSNTIFNIDSCTALEFSLEKYYEDTRRFPANLKESQFIKKNLPQDFKSDNINNYYELFNGENYSSSICESIGHFKYGYWKINTNKYLITKEKEN